MWGCSSWLWPLLARKTDADSADRQTLIRDLLEGQYRHPVRMRASCCPNIYRDFFLVLAFLAATGVSATSRASRSALRRSRFAWNAF